MRVFVVSRVCVRSCASVGVAGRAVVCVGTASEKPEKRRCPPVSARIACLRRGRRAGAVGAAVGAVAGLRLVEGVGAGLAGAHLLQQLGALRLGRRALDAVDVRLRLGRRRGSIEDVGAGLAEESTSFIGLELCALDVAPMVPSLRAGVSVGAVVVVVVVVGAAIGARVWCVKLLRAAACLHLAGGAADAA